MKAVKIILTAFLAIVFNMGVSLQAHDHSKMSDSKTEAFQVGGKCDMCKTRIEKAAGISGVTKAAWNQETKILTITYNPSVVTAESVQKSIAAAGHDTGKFKADDKVYNGLPACCHYERIK